MKILCTGDLHIGRRSSRIPSALDGRQFSCAASWELVVASALDQRVDLVAISGDVADRSNRYFEALGPLERGIRLLAEAKIHIFAVSGNHDFDVLPRLAATVGDEYFHLLGAGGRWERAAVPGRNGPALHVDGWSFPQEQVSTNPLASYDHLPAGQAQGQEQVPVLGLLHCDLDQPRSRYGPVALAELQARTVAMWLIGHIHGARVFSRPGSPVVLYPGSPQAMDPGERGHHGPWIAEIGTGRPIEPRQILTSTVHYCSLDIDLTGVDDQGEAERRIADAVRDQVARAASGDPGPLECICCRIRLTGRTPLHRRLPALLQSVQSDLAPSAGGICGVIESISYETGPVIDLHDLARRNDPPGELARTLLALKSGAPAAPYTDLLARAADRLRDVHQSRPYEALSTELPPDQERVRAYLYAEGLSLLDALVSQKESA